MESVQEIASGTIREFRRRRGSPGLGQLACLQERTRADRVCSARMTAWRKVADNFLTGGTELVYT